MSLKAYSAICMMSILNADITQNIFKKDSSSRWDSTFDIAEIEKNRKKNRKKPKNRKLK